MGKYLHLGTFCEAKVYEVCADLVYNKHKQQNKIIVNLCICTLEAVERSSIETKIENTGKM